MRFLMVDGLTELDSGRSVAGYKAWSLSEDVFQDHFPGSPIVPGVLLVESMAQMLGFLIERSYRDRFDVDCFISPILTIIQKAKFRRFVLPGETVDMKGTLLSLDKRRASGTARAEVIGEVKAEVALSFAITTFDRNELPPELIQQRESYTRFVWRRLMSAEDRAP